MSTSEIFAIDAAGLSRIFHPPGASRVEALPPRDLRVRAGESVALTGASGCGKSTLLGLLSLMEAPSAGVLRLFGTDVSVLGRSARARFRQQHIGVVFQNFCLLKDRSVLANVELPLAYAELSPAKRRERALDWLGRVGLGNLAHRHPTELSGGQQQRVAIARAMATGPRLLLADEPTGSLDRDTGERVSDDLLRFCADTGATCVIATHDPLLAARCARVERMDRDACR
ncbi:MAG TPA: ABC transporter ATP-binding protein [Burkholderiaceae bacterium]